MDFTNCTRNVDILCKVSLHEYGYVNIIVTNTNKNRVHYIQCRVGHFWKYLLK